MRWVYFSLQTGEILAYDITDPTGYVTNAVRGLMEQGAGRVAQSYVDASGRIRRQRLIEPRWHKGKLVLPGAAGMRGAVRITLVEVLSGDMEALVTNGELERVPVESSFEATGAELQDGVDTDGKMPADAFDYRIKLRGVEMLGWTGTRGELRDGERNAQQ